MNFKSDEEKREYFRLASQRYRLRHPDKIKAYNDAHNNRKVWFKNKRIVLKENPRKGICSQCGIMGNTVMHHDQYIPDSPLDATRELCRVCHNLQHPEVMLKARNKKNELRKLISLFLILKTNEVVA